MSNKAEWAVVELCEQYFPSLFDAVLGDDGIRPLKPSPEAISSALEIMGVEKENAVYVGDQEVDGLSAKNAGLPLLGAAWGFRGEKALRDAGAQEIFTDFSQLEEYILSRAKNLIS